MCFPAPGPRCSYHAHKEYLSALSRYENSLNADDKIALGELLDIKRDAYYSTPRGQNFLRREADARQGLERENFLLQLQKGQKTREQQVKDYQSMIERKDTSFKERKDQAGIKISKYGTAAALGLLFFKESYPHKEAKIVSRDTLELNDGAKILVLPSKYQAKWASATLEDGKYVSEGDALNDVLNSSISFVDLSENSQDAMLDWFGQQLESKGYIGVASVNTSTQDVALFGIHNLESTYVPSLKVASRLGGTTNYYGDVDLLKKLVKGTPFEGGRFVKVEDLKKTILFDVPPQAESAKKISEEFYLGWHENSEGGHYEVRRRHISKNYDVIVKLKAKRVLFASGVDDEMKKLLKPEV